ncbi:hypothetical protein EWB00_009841 [Schistosoma japonicum]|uniref:Uncharacterized protein n=1 Tax=Schistosoma japonicum TaxID=6182 RepID=A0A4Z2DQW2_SCHJA|nr:hypothetical protein EWB00_009841 [Schistosoma japonicum]
MFLSLAYMVVPTNLVTQGLLQELVTKLTDVCANGIYVEKFSKRVSFTLKPVICDAPARADGKRTIGHNGKAACDKCSVVGIQVNNRKVFPDGTCTLRDDKSF